MSQHAHKKVCPSCDMRYRVTPLRIFDGYNPLELDAKTIAWFENAARFFDEDSEGQRFTAEQFIEWLRPDLMGKPPAALFDGAPQRNVDGSPAAHRGEHRHPDPIPWAGRLGGGEAA